ncbi:MAG: hypothetical protein B1H08_02520 [Candidatus Omnitrophica bacterium 4484_171]|nr:MAG: hypothetical protein B1H08_02520 [Candidatus Omnitrophica bacterium 4484_171]
MAWFDFKKRIGEIIKNKDKLIDLSRNEFKEKYSGSVLGVFWAIIAPVILAFSIKIVFTNIFGVKIDGFFIFIISGIFPWIFFSDGTIGALNAFYTKKSLLKQINLLPEFIPFSSVLSSFFNFLITLTIFMPLFVWVNHKNIMVFLLLPLYIFLFLTFILGMGGALAFFNMLSKDTYHFIISVITIWFWITPVFYSQGMVPFPWRWICLLNPLTYYIKCFQDVLFLGHWPGVTTTFIVMFISTLVFYLAIMLFIARGKELVKML